MFLESQDEIIGLPISEQKAIAVADLILPIAQLLTTDCEELKLLSTGFDCQVKQLGKDWQEGKIRLSIEFIPEKRIAQTGDDPSNIKDRVVANLATADSGQSTVGVNTYVQGNLKGKGDKIACWADTVRLASRTYESGKRDLAFKFLKKVAEQIHTDEERKRLDNLLINEIRDKGIWVHYHSLIFQGGSTAIKL
jgi:hypothetical protein